MSPDPRRAVLVHFQRFPDIRLDKQARSLTAAGWDCLLLARRDVRGRADGRAGHPYADAAVATGPGRLIVRPVVAEPATRLASAASMPYGLNPVWLRAVDRAVRDQRPEVVLVRDIPLAPAAIRVGRRHGVPVVLDLAENYPAVLADWRADEGPAAYLRNGLLRNIRLARRLERWAVDNADAVLTVVPESARRVSALRGRPGVPPIAVVENTPVVDELRAAARSEVDCYPDRAAVEVAYTGEVHVYRGIRTVLEAARLLRDDGGPRVRWTVVGTGKTAAALGAEARAAGLDGVVRFLGWQPELVPFVAQADVVAVPSRSSPHTESTMPNKLYDAMALGRPVVVSDVAPMARVVSASGSGEVFRAGDPAGLAAAVRRLGDPAARARAGAAGEAAVRDRYSWAVDGRLFVEVLDAVAGRRPLPTAAEAER